MPLFINLFAIPPIGIKLNNLSPNGLSLGSYLIQGQFIIYSYFIGLPVSESKLSNIESSKSLFNDNKEI